MLGVLYRGIMSPQGYQCQGKVRSAIFVFLFQCIDNSNYRVTIDRIVDYEVMNANIIKCYPLKTGVLRCCGHVEHKVTGRDVTDSESDGIRHFFRNPKSDGYLKSDPVGFEIFVSVQL